MAAAKTNLFNKELKKKSDLFRVLGHPARLQILLHLAQTKQCLCGDISGIFPLSRTTLNQHMKELKEAGLVEGQKRGLKTVYCLNKSKIRELEIILKAFSEEISIPQDFCCEYIPCN